MENEARKVSIIKASFLIWFLCVVSVFVVFTYVNVIAHTTYQELPSIVVFSNIGLVLLGILSFGVGLLVGVYKILCRYIRNKKRVILLIASPIVLIFVILGGSGYYFYKYHPQYGIQGVSMLQYGYHDGEIVDITREPCSQGDVCIFECLSDKCEYKDLYLAQTTKNTTHTVYLKKLVTVTDDCYFFEGNTWIVDANHPGSYDSRNYGCLMPSDFRAIGVVKPPVNQGTKAYIAPFEASSQNNLSDSQKVDNLDVLISRVGRLTTFSEEDTDPVMGSVVSLGGLEHYQFYSKAQIGDRALIFQKSKRAILYRPSTDEIVNDVQNYDDGG